MNPAQNLHLYFSKGNYAICSLTEYKQNLKMVEPEEVEQIYF